MSASPSLTICWRSAAMKAVWCPQGVFPAACAINRDHVNLQVCGARVRTLPAPSTHEPKGALYTTSQRSTLQPNQARGANYTTSPRSTFNSTPLALAAWIEFFAIACSSATWPSSDFADDCGSYANTGTLEAAATASAMLEGDPFGGCTRWSCSACLCGACCGDATAPGFEILTLGALCAFFTSAAAAADAAVVRPRTR